MNDIMFYRSKFRPSSLSEERAWILASEHFESQEFSIAGPDINGDYAARLGHLDIVIYHDGTIDKADYSEWPPDPGEAA